MGKGINTDAMDKLISGLSGNEENISIEHEQANEESHTSEPPKQSQKSKGNRNQPVKQHICATVNADSLNKIRAIAKTEGLTINSIIDLGLDIVIKKYEELHGTIQVKKPKKGDVYYTFELLGDKWVVRSLWWGGFPNEYALLEKGWVYRTKEEAEAALPDVAAEMGVEYEL